MTEPSTLLCDWDLMKTLKSIVSREYVCVVSWLSILCSSRANEWRPQGGMLRSVLETFSKFKNKIFSVLKRKKTKEKKRKVKKIWMLVLRL